MESQTFSSSSPLKFLSLARPLLSQISHLDIDDTQATDAIVQLLFAQAGKDLDLLYEFSNWLVTVSTKPSTTNEFSNPSCPLQDRLLRKTMHHLIESISDPSSFASTTSPTSQTYRRLPISSFLTFFAKNQTKIAPIWPLPILLPALIEKSSKRFVASTQSLWNSSRLPPSGIANDMERLKKLFLERTKEVERAFREAEWAEEAMRSPRLLGSLMQAYNRAGSFEDVERIWKSLDWLGRLDVGRERVDTIVSSFVSSLFLRRVHARSLN